MNNNRNKVRVYEVLGHYIWNVLLKPPSKKWKATSKKYRSQASINLDHFWMKAFHLTKYNKYRDQKNICVMARFEEESRTGPSIGSPQSCMRKNRHKEENTKMSSTDESRCYHSTVCNTGRLETFQLKCG